MKENPVWVKICEEFEADFRRRRADGGRGQMLVVFELRPDVPDFELVPEELEDVEL